MFSFLPSLFLSLSLSHSLPRITHTRRKSLLKGIISADLPKVTLADDITTVDRSCFGYLRMLLAVFYRFFHRLIAFTPHYFMIFCNSSVNFPQIEATPTGDQG
jgi:hypothetical protein